MSSDDHGFVRSNYGVQSTLDGDGSYHHTPKIEEQDGEAGTMHGFVRRQ